jgi:hypothetical protein
MVISKPCLHPDCPPRDGFIRGQYESVEFIREIPLRPKKTFSTTQLLDHGRVSGKEDGSRSNNVDRDESSRASLEQPALSGGRRRGKTISFAESRGVSAKGEAVDTMQDDSDDLSENNPVEWVMVTRSDPGGSVPRFLVERGTPSSIVADASKFLNWAIKKDHSGVNDESENVPEIVAQGVDGHQTEPELEAYQTNGHLAGIDGASSSLEDKSPPSEGTASNLGTQQTGHNQSTGLLTSVANVAYSSIESYAPQGVIDRLHGPRLTPSVAGSVTSRSNQDGSNPVLSEDHEEASFSSSSSVASFASAEEQFEGSLPHDSTPSLLGSNTADMADMTPQGKELKKLNDRKKTLDEKLARVREKELKDKEEITSREEERLRRAEEKHAREIQKQEEKYKRELARLEAKRAKDAAKDEERRKKAEDKDLKQQLELVSRERDILKEQVGALQRENTALVAKMGKLGDGQDLLRDVRMELSGRPRSRSGSVRKSRTVTGLMLAAGSDDTAS